MATTAQAQAQALDIVRVDRAVEEAIRAGEPGTLRVLGYGELTLVFGWPTRAAGVRRQAAAALPRRRAAGPVRRSARPLYRRAARSRCPGGAHRAARHRGERRWPPRAIWSSRSCPARRQLNFVLREAAPETGAALLDTLVGYVAAVVDAELGLDAQASNWAVDGRRARLLRPLDAADARARRQSRARSVPVPLDLPLGPPQGAGAGGARGDGPVPRRPHGPTRRGLEPRQGAPRPLAAGVPRGGCRAGVAPDRGGRGAPLLRPRQEALASNAVVAPRRPRVAAPGAAPAVPVLAASPYHYGPQELPESEAE